MANVIKTVMTYPLNGSTRDFNIPFEYLARKFVQVTLLGVDRKVLTLNTDYRFSTKTTITTTQAWGSAQGYTQIEIRRYTSATERLVDFTDGSILRAYDLNIAQIQTMHVAEEARDLTADTIGVNNEGHLDARGRRIVNLGNAVADRDAVPFGQLKTMNQNAWDAQNKAQSFRNEAQTFRNQAESFKNEANNFKNQAAASQTAAKTSETNAKNSENAAAASKGAAATSQAAAKTSETNAKNSENAARGQADLAKKWASNPRNQKVDATEYSAKHYSEVAKEESAKLGNWNQLAGTVESVSGANVKFKGTVDANALNVRSGAVEMFGNTPYIDFHKGNSSADYTHRIIASQDGLLDFTTGGNFTGHVNTPQVNFRGTGSAYITGDTRRYRSRNDSSITSEVFLWNNPDRGAVLEWNTNQGSGYTMYLQRKAGGQALLNVNGAIEANTTVTAKANGAAYKLTYAAGQAGYILAMKGGTNAWYLGNGAADDTVTWHSYKFTTTAQLKTDQFYSNKMIVSGGEVRAGNGSARLAADGNVYGSKWGNQWLDAWVNTHFKKKTKAWTQVWAGTMGGGASGTLSQDIRFRTIWIRIGGGENRYMPVQIGPDGQYYVPGWGDGWLKFQVFNNGRGFKNIQDKTTVPTQIVVENE